MAPDCALCADLEVLPAGAVVIDEPEWVVFVHPSYRRDGCLWVQAREHVEGLWSLTDAQAASFAEVARSSAAALRSAAAAPRVYVVSFGENFPHFHALLIARGDDVPPSDRGLELVGSHLRSKDDRDDAAAIVKAAALRAHLPTSAGAQ
jgi:diadenosine tetraphosphate (Ap4A) HIT family hydrolase